MRLLLGGCVLGCWFLLVCFCCVFWLWLVEVIAVLWFRCLCFSVLEGALRFCVGYCWFGTKKGGKLLLVCYSLIMLNTALIPIMTAAGAANATM